MPIPKATAPARTTFTLIQVTAASMLTRLRHLGLAIPCRNDGAVTDRKVGLLLSTSPGRDDANPYRPEGSALTGRCESSLSRLELCALELFRVRPLNPGIGQRPALL